jgi:hypothetical protein
MRFLSNYLNFILEAVAKQEMRLYYSDEFRNMLRRLQSKSSIAQALLNSEDSNQMLDIYTLIDITEKNDTISLIQVNRITRGNPELGETLPYSIRDKKRGSEFWTKARTDIGIGRWVRRIFTEVHKSTILDSKIEEFVNLYKAAIDGEDLTKFELVSGDDIRKWYLKDNYEQERGQLGNSCMRYRNCQDFFDIYVKNPEVCQLLILKSDDDKNKITGRALIWKLTDGNYYMDRIYTINDSDKLLFQDYARINKIESSYDGNSSLDLEVKLGDHTYQKYPHMDTLVVYNPTTKILRGDEDLWPGQGYISIQDTQGGFRSDDVVWSEWSEEYISRDRAVRCENVDDWLDKSEAKYLEYKDVWVAPNDDVVYSEWSDEWYYLDDCHYSECMGDWLYVDDENVITMISNEHGDEDYCVKSLYELYVKVGNDYYLRSACVKDPFTGEYKFKTSDYEKSLDERLMKEFGIERNDTTLDRRGNPSTKVLDDVREDLKLRLLKLKLSDDIKKLIEENPIYKKQVRGVYWGLHKDDMPTEEDIFALLKSFMVSKNTSSYQGSVYLSNVMGKFIFFRSEEMNKSEQNFKRFHSCGVLQKMIRVCMSFDFIQFPEDIYKRYLFITI